jgi:hypothetical protein
MHPEVMARGKQESQPFQAGPLLQDRETGRRVAVSAGGESTRKGRSSCNKGIITGGQENRGSAGGKDLA